MKIPALFYLFQELLLAFLFPCYKLQAIGVALNIECPSVILINSSFEKMGATTTEAAVASVDWNVYRPIFNTAFSQNTALFMNAIYQFGKAEISVQCTDPVTCAQKKVTSLYKNTNSQSFM